VVRFAVIWLVDALSLLLAAWVVPGISLVDVDGTSRVLIAISAALVLAIVNLLIRPAIFLIARPLGWIAQFVIGFFVNAIALWITAWLLPGFDVSILGGIVGAIVLAFFNAVLTGILEINESGSYYQNRIERRAKEQPFDSASEPGRGLMMLEIDGLSYWHIHKALDDGLIENAIASALHSAEAAHISGKGLTPFLLSAIAKETENRSILANRALVLANAQVAADVAFELAASRGPLADAT